MVAPPLPKKRVVIAGAGPTGCELARLMADAWQVIVLDPDPTALARLRAEVPEERAVHALQLDATSLLNLREAGADGAAWVIAMTNRDDANVEICRLALSLQLPPAALAVVESHNAQEKLKALGAEALLRPKALAALVANQIDRGMRVAVSVGLGRGEVVEIPVLASSPAAGLRVSELKARRWLVAAIYRGAEIIVPHGQARINVGDRLLLSGEPDVLPRIADHLRAGVPRFPLQFGEHLIVCRDDSAAFWSEVAYLARHTRTAGVKVLLPEGTLLSPAAQLTHDQRLTQVARPRDEPLGAFLHRAVRELSPGCLLLPKVRSNWACRTGLMRPDYARLMEILPCPTLLVSGTPSYQRVLLPVADSAGTAPAADLAIDLARQLGLPLVAVAVDAPAFVAGQMTEEEQQRALRRTSEAAALYRLQLEEVRLLGNPVRELANITTPGDLLVVATRAGRNASLFRPDTSQLIIEHASCSVLCLPYHGPRGVE